MAHVVVENEARTSNGESPDAVSIKVARTETLRTYKSGDWQLAIEQIDALLDREQIDRGMAIEMLSRSYCELLEWEKAFTGKWRLAVGDLFDPLTWDVVHCPEGT